MYRINKAANNVIKLEQRLFKELHIREREHLQEWIAKNPEMLGEELLIIQKEFRGFSETNERLDILAIDKDGGLVIIENKLDDTGTNVVWQALKYTSYCSTLTTAQIIKIYQDYIDRWGNGEDAKESLLEFLERDQEELLLNRNDQRMVFISNNFRKEVTSTVLWLINHDIQIQCFRAIPYSMGEDLFLQMEQIIPLPETKEFMIDIKEKEKEEKEKSKSVEEGEARLIKFWGQLKQNLQEHNIDYLDKVGAKPAYYIGFSKGNGFFSYSIGRTSFRVELYFSYDQDKKLIDTMAQHREQIEKSFGSELVWERLENKKASRIKFEIPVDIKNDFEGLFKDEKYWDPLIEWYRDAMVKFYNSVYPVWEKVQKEI
ncbi:MAG: DUF4268 domain-containing protein [Bacteroidales bacterium]|nr:DUF4268 domain-containing protein [Bacteroidales bacterium]MCB9012777.1 DUF4268 domain-containing protein [Bacteroidales bacterium]